MNGKSIEFEFSQIEAELDIIQMLKVVNDQNGLDKIQLRAAASSLHSIYNGLEKILYIILKNRNITIPSSSKWHTLLLEKALKEQIITENQYSSLKEYMGFRHFFRHNYGFMIDSELITPLLDNAAIIVKQLKNKFI
ncbi:hypothetical protein [Marispirochaeta aestuarii]|uniref:ribonuclease toxin HepT-like protein n=1 Tax=Marispirochaeta aestuarii TaxID=1963862 RepID=UPI0029C6A5A9|nr:hypothetical protein [Marispirochaeta aestuarii]